ncbi:MAG: 2-oxo acid dehydrogenase subunit E2 [Clostridiales Family XIII bacterium]|nr:2-oxo acid dehydrogenase subunit E2 [Clostridiales Family XIII bacterium]
MIPSEDKIIAKARAIVAHAAPASAGAPGGRLRISPLAANMAAAKGIDPAAISGSGPNGRIMKRDVAAAAVPAPGAGAGAPSPSPAAQGGKTLLESRPYAGVRKIIGDRLAQSKFTAPHLYFTQKAVLDELLALRAMVNARRERKTSVTDFIAKAVVIALQKYPEMNASLAGDTVELYSSVNLGIAVAAPSGLIVPVVREAQGKSLAQISDEASALFEKARNGRLTPDEYSGGTFTISNLGMFGIENFTAIINPPESGILAISSTKDEAVVVKGDTGEKSLAIKPVMNITLSVDHRLIDGLLAASFVTEVKRLLESPMEILI